MPRATLEVAIPTDAWMHGVSTDRPAVAFRVVSAALHDGTGVGVLEVAGEDPLAALTRMDREPALVGVDLLWSDEREALVQFETSEPSLLRLAGRAGVPVPTPFEVDDGRARWELVTTRDRLGRLRDQLSAAGVEFDLAAVESVESHGADGALTDRQREVLLAARELGYYEVPRRATLTEVADALGIAKSTASDTLHRAESHLLDAFVEGRDPG